MRNDLYNQILIYHDIYTFFVGKRYIKSDNNEHYVMIISIN